MPSPAIPLTVLGGSDRRASKLPPSGKNQQPLTGCKGVDLTIEGRPLITAIAERLSAHGFGPIYAVGPKSIYQGVPGIEEVFDSDSGFGDNIRVGVEAMVARHPDQPLAMATCDILPDGKEVEQVLADFRREAPSDLFFPMILAPADSAQLGRSAWKPRYQIAAEADDADQEPIPVLPSHIAIFDPTAMRLRFLYRLLSIGYGLRNRSMRARRWFFVRRMFSSILYRDLMNVLSFRLPTLTFETLVHGSIAGLALSRGRLSRSGLERAMRGIFTRRAHRRAYPQRRIRMPILDALSFAKDIDTVEEAESLGVRPGAVEPGPTANA